VVFLTGLLGGPSLCVPEAAGAVVRSYDGNFLVAAPDTTTAAETASLAERTRTAVFELLGHEEEWERAARVYLTVRTKATAEGRVPLWTVSVSKGGFKGLEADVYPSARNDVMVLQVVTVCLEAIAGPMPREAEREAAGALPVWLSCGVAENLSAANVARFRQFAAEIVRNGTFHPMDELFQTEGFPSDEAERELFFKQSGSVVDLLLHQREGRTKLRQAIRRFRTDNSLRASLLFEFSADFGSDVRLEERWKEFAVRSSEKIIGGPKMSLVETQKALDLVLRVTIPVIDRDTLEEKVVTTDLSGLFRHRNALTAQKIAAEKTDEVAKLSLRARREYVPILQEYFRALSAILGRDRGAFKKHFALAERLREKLEQSPQFEVEETANDDTSNE
jgi:hypothetical protein